MIQLSMWTLVAADDGESITFEIVHRASKERKRVQWVASIRGAILADGFTGCELKFRSGSGEGVMNCAGWFIPKRELAKLRNKVDAAI